MGYWEALAQYGLAGFIFVGFLMTLRWVFQVNSKILADMNTERMVAAEVRRGFIEQLREMSATNREFQKTVDEAHRFQRAEHKEMIDVLGRINGYKGGN